MHVMPCRPYHARLYRTQTLALPDGVSAFKLYFISLLGRDPDRFEWEQAPGAAVALEARLTALRPDGVGFVTAFPHITKLFRFAPSAETVLHVHAFHTADLAPLDLAREDACVEFACYAEAVIAADEYHAWARARSVAEYLAAWSPFEDGPIVNPAKLAAYAAAHVQR